MKRQRGGGGYRGGVDVVVLDMARAMWEYNKKGALYGWGQ